MRLHAFPLLVYRVGALAQRGLGSRGFGGFGGLGRSGGGGAKLTHDHPTQFTFVRQTLMLWREIMGNMYKLWAFADADMLENPNAYQLWNTGQGLNRVQACPRVAAEMERIKRKVQRESGPWVGISVVHLGDRDVPNALVFIDKYTQVCCRARLRRTSARC